MAIQPTPPTPPRGRHTRSPSTPDPVEGNPYATASPRTPNHPSDDHATTNTTGTTPSGASVRTPTSGSARYNPYEPPNLLGAPLAQRRGSPQVVELDDGVRSLAGSVGYTGGSDGGSQVGCSEDGREGLGTGIAQEGAGSGSEGMGVSRNDIEENDGGEDTKSEYGVEDTPRVGNERMPGGYPGWEGNSSGGNVSDSHSDPFPYSCSSSRSNLLHDAPPHDTPTELTTAAGEENAYDSTSSAPSHSGTMANAIQEWFTYLEGLGVRLKEDMEGVDEVGGLLWVMEGLPSWEEGLGDKTGFTTAAEVMGHGPPPPESTTETTILTLCSGSTYHPRPLVLFIITTAEPATTASDTDSSSSHASTAVTLDELVGIAVYRAVLAVHLARKTHAHATRAFIQVEGYYALIETGGDGVYQIYVYSFGDVGLRVGREKAVGDLMEGVVQAWVGADQDDEEAEWKSAVEKVVIMFKDAAIDQFMAGVGEPEEGLNMGSSSNGHNTVNITPTLEECREHLIFDGVRVCVPDAEAMRKELRKKRAGAGAAA